MFRKYYETFDNYYQISISEIKYLITVVKFMLKKAKRSRNSW